MSNLTTQTIELGGIRYEIEVIDDTLIDVIAMQRIPDDPLTQPRWEAIAAAWRARWLSTPIDAFEPTRTPPLSARDQAFIAFDHADSEFMAACSRDYAMADEAIAAYAATSAKRDRAFAALAACSEPTHTPPAEQPLAELRALVDEAEALYLRVAEAYDASHDIYERARLFQARSRASYRCDRRWHAWDVARDEQAIEALAGYAPRWLAA